MGAKHVALNHFSSPKWTPVEDKQSAAWGGQPLDILEIGFQEIICLFSNGRGGFLEPLGGAGFPRNNLNIYFAPKRTGSLE